MKAIVIGSGVAGLASAVRLAAAGYQVRVFEAGSTIGGKLQAFEQDGYRFDKGPSLFTMPHFIEELIDLCDVSTRFEYQKVPVACRYFWDDGTALTGHSKPADFAQEIEQKLGVPQKRITDYFRHAQNIHDSSAKIFLEQSLHKVGTWLSRETLRSLMKIHQFDIGTTMHRANQKRLSHPRLVQLFDRFATYNGSDPYRAPGILNVIPWLEHGYGTFFPADGMRQIPETLYKLALSQGVEFQLSTKVDAIDIEGEKVSGVMAGGQLHKAEVVVSNMDVVHTYRKLMPTAPAPELTLQAERSSSAMIFYWGIKRTFEQLDLHNIFFANDYRSEFEAINSKTKVHEDPTVYVHISSKFKPDDAPAGCENWFVMVNVPSDIGQDWDQWQRDIRAHVLRKLKRVLDADIESLIETEHHWNPRGIAEDTMSYQGALYGSSSNSRLAAFLRHPNFSSSTKGLYFAGGSVHPGGGIPLCLLSAKITTELIQHDFEAQ